MHAVIIPTIDLPLNILVLKAFLYRENAPSKMKPGRFKLCPILFNSVLAINKFRLFHVKLESLLTARLSSELYISLLSI